MIKSYLSGRHAVVKIGKSFGVEVDGILSDFFQRNISACKRPHPALTPQIVFNESQNIGNGYDLDIFTDGSKTGSSVGSAFCAFKGGAELEFGKYRIGPFCSVFQAELVAMKKSSRILETEH
jgi:hypothetical protein